MVCLLHGYTLRAAGDVEMNKTYDCLQKLPTLPEEPDTRQAIRLSVHKPYEHGTWQ